MNKFSSNAEIKLPSFECFSLFLSHSHHILYLSYLLLSLTSSQTDLADSYILAPTSLLALFNSFLLIFISPRSRNTVILIFFFFFEFSESYVSCPELIIHGRLAGLRITTERARRGNSVRLRKYRCQSGKISFSAIRSWYFRVTGIEK